MGNVAVEYNEKRFRRMIPTEPEWFYKMRRESWEKFLNTPLPDRVTHLWRYTKPENFLISNPDPLMNSTVLPGIGVSPNGYDWQSEYSARGVEREDFTSGIVMTDQLAEAGVIIKNLRHAVNENEDIVEGYLGKLVGNDFGKFEALNLALWNTGFLLYIPDNTVIEKPIHLSRVPVGQAASSRLLVVVGRNCQATVIDDYTSPSEKAPDIFNGVVELFVNEASNVRYVSLQRLSENTKMFMTQRMRAEQQANVYTVFGSFGSKVGKFDAGSILNGAGAESRMYGMAFGSEKQHFDHHTVHHHTHGETYSNLDVKVVLKDRAVSAYTGLIRIEEHADVSEAYQENRNLLLNENTQADSIPELEILTDQVSCSHGATVGPIDPEMIFYLRSRGYSMEEAVRAIVTGFVEPTFKEVPEDLRDNLRKAVLEKLEAE